MIAIKITKFRLPTWAYFVLVTGDVSAVCEHEEAVIDTFEANVIKRHGVGHWEQCDTTSHGFFSSYNDLTTDGDTCVDVDYVVVTNDEMEST
jgi:hypothetical protein